MTRRDVSRYSIQRNCREEDRLADRGSVLPVKVNTASVIPIIFSSSLLQFPLVIQQLVGANPDGIPGFIFACLNQANWCDPEHPERSVGLVVYLLLTVLFAYFYTSITFNPLEIANNMKKTGRIHSRYPAGQTDSGLSECDPELHYLHWSHRSVYHRSDPNLLQWSIREQTFPSVEHL